LHGKASPLYLKESKNLNLDYIFLLHYYKSTMKNRGWKMVLLALAFSFHGYYIYHPFDDLWLPEIYWPDSNGNRPGPGRPMVPVTVMMDEKLGVGFDNWEAVQAAISAWNHIDGSSASLVYGGGVFLEGDFGNRLAIPDGMNTVELVKSGWPFGLAVVAITHTFYDADTGQITEADSFLNGQDYSWGNSLFDDVSADTQNIVTHELGHLLGLGESQVLDATMYTGIRPSETRWRILHKDDEDGIRWLYPVAASDIPGPSLWLVGQGGCATGWSYLAGPAVVEESATVDSFCLYAAGMTGINFDVQMVSQSTGQVISPASNISFISDNLLTMDIDLSQLPIDSYSLTLTQDDGKSGSMIQGILVTQPGATLPVAQISPAETTAAYNDKITLDGSASTGDNLRYHWVQTDGPATINLEGQTGSSITFQPPKPGDYVIALMVDDGVDYSVAAQSVVSIKPKKTNAKYEMFGCQAAPASQASGAAMLVLPFLFYSVIRLGRRLRAGF
jgi:hypothetical protein